MDNHEGPDRNDVRPATEGEQLAGAAPWLIRNGPYLVLFAGMLAFLQYRGWGAEDYWNVVKVVLGLGLMIFVHELGHFLVAKWCDVHVETFSIGFGPPLPGCIFRRGETTYMIALFPLGGYVKMVGEGAESDESDADPRSFKNKSVGQRMAIISAGVIMNVILGFACFVFVFMAHGAEQVPGSIDIIEPGSPAWQIGVRTGDIIHQIGSQKNDPPFEKIQPTIMLTKEGEGLPFAFSAPGVPEGEWRRVEVVPRKDEEDLKPKIGFGPPFQLQMGLPRDRKSHELPVYYNSAADRATPEFSFGDRIIGTTDPDHPDQVSELPKDPRDSHGKKRDYFEFGRRLKRLAGQPMVIRVLREDDEGASAPKNVDIQLEGAFHRVFGMRMRMGAIAAVRNNSPADQAKVQPGDIIDHVEVTDAAGKTVRYVTARNPQGGTGDVIERPLDPERLPFDLAKWAAEKTGERTVTLTVLRTNPPPQDGKPGAHKERDRVPLTLKWDDSWRFNKEVPLGMSSPISVPELGLAYRIETTVEEVRPNSPAAAQGIQPGDVVKQIRFWGMGKKRTDKLKPDRWVTLEPSQWAQVHVAASLMETSNVDFRLARGKDEYEVSLESVEDRDWPLPERGLLLMRDTYLQKADTFAQAIAMGADRTGSFIMQIYGNLRGFATGRLSPQLVAGPVTIGTAAFNIAGNSFYEFITFLGIISVNLAVINFLPIPVLDGGHMVFLIYEKLRGQPASEQVRIAATYLGLAVIACLMIFALYVDVKRLI